MDRVNPNLDGKTKTAIGIDRQAELRGEAERLVREAGTAAPADPADEHRLLHELQVHHVELQLQNEELEAAHADAAAARDRYARLFDLSPVGVLEVATDGRIVEANLAAAGMLEGTKSLLAGARIDQQLALASVPTWRALLATTGQAGHGQAELELARPGSQTTVLHAESALDATAGSVLVTLVDISERSRAQAAEREAALMLEQANRAKGEFLMRMSHELRTPLNALLGFAQLMLADQRQRLEPAQRARVEHIERAGQQLLALIEASMDVARIEPGRIDFPPQPQPQPQQPPLEDDPAAHGAGPAGTGRRKSRRVLVIGDVQADRDLIEATVQTLPDATLTTAIDGRSGIATARILRPDLVIVGLELPDMEGAAVLRALRLQQQARKVRCVALSTGTASDETAEADSSDFLECWGRPLAADFLRSRLHVLLA